MPRKAKRKSKASVDARTRAVRHSAREQEAATEAPARDPSAEVAARRHAENLAEATRYIRGDESADRGDAGDSERLQAEQARVKEWAGAKGCLIEEADFEALRVISNSTSEHEVRSRPADGCVVKKNVAGFLRAGAGLESWKDRTRACVAFAIPRSPVVAEHGLQKCHRSRRRDGVRQALNDLRRADGSAFIRDFAAIHHGAPSRCPGSWRIPDCRFPCRARFRAGARFVFRLAARGRWRRHPRRAARQFHPFRRGRHSD